MIIAFAMLGFNFVGDGLRDALDPTMYNVSKSVFSSLYW